MVLYWHCGVENIIHVGLCQLCPKFYPKCFLEFPKIHSYYVHELPYYALYILATYCALYQPVKLES